MVTHWAAVQGKRFGTVSAPPSWEVLGSGVDSSGLQKAQFSSRETCGERELKGLLALSMERKQTLPESGSMRTEFNELFSSPRRRTGTDLRSCSLKKGLNQERTMASFGRAFSSNPCAPAISLSYTQVKFKKFPQNQTLKEGGEKNYSWRTRES